MSPIYSYIRTTSNLDWSSKIIEIRIPSILFRRTMEKWNFYLSQCKGSFHPVVYRGFPLGVYGIKIILYFRISWQIIYKWMKDTTKPKTLIYLRNKAFLANSVKKDISIWLSFSSLDKPHILSLSLLILSAISKSS